MKYRFLPIIVLIPLILIGCYKDYEFQSLNYTNFNRVVGPKGGIIDFYANYENDTKTEKIVKLEVPPKALDSLMVFNMYQFEDFEVATQMEEGFAKFGSKLLYFVPFYESEGYHERGQLELNYHLSIKFNQPLTVTYYPLANYSDLAIKNWQEVELYNNFYKTTNKSYKVYRIKIPKTDEWGENDNIYVNWTRQGYPNGYDRTDLSYIVNGRWSAIHEWGTGEISMENWELIGEYTLNTIQDFVTFKIYDTDYVYVIARDIYLPLNLVPPVIAGYIGANFQALQIERASYDERNYRLFLSDNSVAVFDKFQGFEYRINDGLRYSDLPTAAQAYIKRYYSSDPIKKVTFIQRGTMQQYEVFNTSGLKLFFNLDGGLVGKFLYGSSSAILPSQAQSYLQTNHKGDLITNVSYDSLNIANDSAYQAKYIVYLSSNAKVTFNRNGSWFQTKFNKLQSKDLPANILSYFATNYPKALFNEINFIKTPTSAFYNIYLVDNKWFYFGAAGKLWEFEFRNLKEDDLPPTVTNYINANFPKKLISNIFYIYKEKEGINYYEIYFADLTDIIISPAGIRID